MNNKIQPLFITIGIPTYNRAGGYLKETLTCATNQTYDNIEIIVSDNCSTDNTPELVKSFNDSRIRYFRQEKNIIANDNFNFCLTQAKGDYFLLLHDDDRIDNDFIETCVREAKGDKNIGIIRTGTRVIDANGNAIYEKENRVEGFSTLDFFLGWFKNQTTLYLCSTLFNTVQLKNIGGFKSRHNLFQDVVAEVILAAQYGRIDCRPVKASFRRHSTNMGNATNVMKWCEDSLQLLDIMCGLIPEEKEKIRAAGLPFFCNQNYLLTANVKGTVQRFITYCKVYKKFEFTYSPYETFRISDLRPLKQYVKKIIEVKNIPRKLNYLTRYHIKFYQFKKYLLSNNYKGKIDNPKACAIVLSYARPKNIEWIVRALLLCPFIEKVIVSNNNPDLKIEEWVCIDDDRLSLLNQKTRRRAGYRYEIARHLSYDYYIFLDDDIYLYPEQIESVYEQLCLNPSIPHGVWGQKVTIHQDRSIEFHNGIRKRNESLDIINRAYFLTGNHAAKFIENMKQLGIEKVEDLQYGDDIILSMSGQGKPACHDVGEIFQCKSTDQDGIALWREGTFNNYREELYRNLLLLSSSRK